MVDEIVFWMGQLTRFWLLFRREVARQAGQLGSKIEYGNQTPTLVCPNQAGSHAAAAGAFYIPVIPLPDYLSADHFSDYLGIYFVACC